jgi:hypothetical protein
MSIMIMIVSAVHMIAELASCRERLISNGHQRSEAYSGRDCQLRFTTRDSIRPRRVRRRVFI